MTFAAARLNRAPGKRRSALRLSCSFATIAILASTTRAADYVELGDGASDFQIGNFDGAGGPDLAVRLSNAVVLLASSGHGTYRELLRYPTGSARFAVGDLDGDSDSDVAVLDFSTRQGVVIRPAGGGFTFEPLNTDDELSPRSLTIADVSGDGLGDLLIVGAVRDSSDMPSGIVQIHLGRRDGLVRASDLRTDPSALEVKVADVDADGASDLILTLWFTSNGVLVFRGQGDGTFGPGVTSAGEPLAFPHELAIGDLNRDGHPDLAIVAGFNSPYGPPPVSQVRFGNGSDRFDSWYRSGQQLAVFPSAVAVGDLDGDSFDDVVYIENGDDESGLVIHRGAAAGALGAPQRIRASHNLGPVRIADLDQDGAPEVAFLVRTGVQILWNSELRPTAVAPSTWTEVRRRFR